MGKKASVLEVKIMWRVLSAAGVGEAPAGGDQDGFPELGLSHKFRAACAMYADDQYMVSICDRS